MSNVVIVAIPDENDRVWKVSSEKVPHLTLLFLGDENEVSNLDQIMQFVEHSANRTLTRFYLPVDRRGELGDDKADVLFFKKGRYDFKAIRDFRATLLQDPNIKTAYDSAPQFDGPWQPHLTLGYPETPANKVSDDQISQFYDVQFNKIAIWTGDFKGPEFLLKDYWDDFDIGELPMDVAMSDLSDHDLTHYGVKGMRWGYRKGDESARADVGRAIVGGPLLAPRSTARVAVRGGKATARGGKKVGKGLVKFGADVYFESATSRDAARRQVVNNASVKWAKEDLPKIDAKYKGTKAESVGSRLKSPTNKDTVNYRRESRIAYRDRVNEEVSKLAPNASGTRRYEIEDGGNTNTQYFWRLKAVDTKNRVEHAEVDSGLKLEAMFDGVELHPVFDTDGFITDVEMRMTSMEQTADLGAEFLAHYGVKGMHWGQRKSPPTAVAPTATSHVPHGTRRKTKIQVEGGENHPAHEDAIKVARAQAKLKKSGTSALSNQELQELQNRLNLERNVTQLVSSTTRVGKGRNFVKGLTGFNKEVNDTANTGFQTVRLAKQVR